MISALDLPWYKDLLEMATLNLTYGKFNSNIEIIRIGFETFEIQPYFVGNFVSNLGLSKISKEVN